MKLSLPRSTAAARIVAFEAFFAVVTLYLARPAFATIHLPLQDLPQHMAAIAVLKRYAFEHGLRAYFELTLSRTQYLLVYLIGVPLSFPFGVEYATRLLVALTVVSIPYSLRFALRRTGGDERLAALAWPFAWNPQMMFGFLNFLLGIPVALVAIGLFADRERRATRGRQIQLALLALGAFYSHLIPYGLLGLGALLLLDVRGADARIAAVARGSVAAGDSPTPGMARAKAVARAVLREAGPCALRWVRELLFLVPSLLAAVLWVLRSPARDPTIRAGGVGRQNIQFEWPQRPALPAEFRDTILNTQGVADELALIAWGLALLAVLALARATRREAREEPAWISAGARVAWLPAACATLYVFAPASYGWIWPIHTRFAVAAVLLLPLAMPRLRGHVGAWAVMLAMAWGGIGIARAQVTAFQTWDRVELGDLDEALSHARPGRRLVALVPAMGSALMPSNVPLLHVAAYYQVRGGDVATFSFVDFPQSPFRFREGPTRPVRLQPRWEWMASLRTADPQHDYYDYVLVRRGHWDEPAQQPELYSRIYQGDQWYLYERRR